VRLLPELRPMRSMRRVCICAPGANSLGMGVRPYQRAIGRTIRTMRKSKSLAPLNTVRFEDSMDM